MGRLIPPVQPRFLGLSVAFPAVASDTGQVPAGVMRFEQLVRNLSPGAAPVFRIGADSTDATGAHLPSSSVALEQA